MEENKKYFSDELDTRKASFEDITPLEEQDVYDYEESLVKKRKNIGIYWKKPATKVYSDNFGYGVNGYQPMIDYLDKKDSGISVNKSEVHLPYYEERCMNKYSSQNPIKYYNNFDIDKYIDKGEKIRTQIRQNDAAGASNVLRRTHTNWSMTNKLVQSVRNSSVETYKSTHSDKEKIAKVAPILNRNLSRLHYPLYNNLTSILPLQILCRMANADIYQNYLSIKLDHDIEMSVRRQRLNALENQYENAIGILTRNVDRLSNRTESISTKLADQPSRCYSLASEYEDDGVILGSRSKREHDLYKMNRQVDAMTDYRMRPSYSRISVLPRENNFVPTSITPLDNPYPASISSGMRNHYPFSPYLDGDIELRPRYPKKREEDIVSDVQMRIIDRANEMAGTSNGAIRIKNKARCVNQFSLRPEDGNDLTVFPSQTKENISNIYKSFAHSNFPDRRLRVDREELFVPSRSPPREIPEIYNTREYEKPGSHLSSESHRLRNAKVRSRARTLLLVD